MDVDTFFSDHEPSKALYERINELVQSLGEVENRVTKSQIAFRRRRTFAAVWMPEQYLGRGDPLVLTVFLRRRDPSPRWKEVVEPAPGRFTHHLELNSAGQIDDEVRGWIEEAWMIAGESGTRRSL